MLPPDAPDASINRDPGAGEPGAGGPIPAVPAMTTIAAQRRFSILTLSVVLVALLAGSALFLSGYSVGRQAAVEPGTPGVGGRCLPAVLGYL